MSLSTLKRARRDLAEWGVIWHKPGRGRGINTRYLIKPVPPGTEPAPDGKPPFRVPGTAGKGVSVCDPFSAAPEKGSRPPVKGVTGSRKRGQPESADLPKRERKVSTSREDLKEKIKTSLSPAVTPATTVDGQAGRERDHPPDQDHQDQDPGPGAELAVPGPAAVASGQDQHQRQDPAPVLTGTVVDLRHHGYEPGSVVGSGTVYGQFDAAARWLLDQVPGADPHMAEQLVLALAPAGLNNGRAWAQWYINQHPSRTAAGALAEFTASWQVERQTAAEEASYQQWRDAERQAEREQAEARRVAERAGQAAAADQARAERAAAEQRAAAARAEAEAARQAQAGARDARAGRLTSAHLAEHPGADRDETFSAFRHAAASDASDDVLLAAARWLRGQPRTPFLGNRLRTRADAQPAQHR